MKHSSLSTLGREAAEPAPNPDARAVYTPLPDEIVEQAIAWYVRRASGTMTPQEQRELGQWLAAHRDHARAWERLRTMGGRVQASASVVSPSVTHAAMARLAAVSGRRQAIKTLLWIGAGTAGVYLAQARTPWRSQLAAATADFHTSTGERRSLALQDGTLLQLNTATAVDLRFDARERRVALRHGEIMVATAADPAGRPFLVETPEGTLTPVGTRFTVRYDEAGRERRVTRLAVTEGAVRVRARDLPAEEATLVHAQQGVRFTRGRVGAPGPLDEAGQAWIDGTLVAEDMALSDFLAELDRYRHGKLSWADDVGGLRITGAWPLDGPEATDRILDSLERRLPLRVQRYTRFWTRIAARP